jgi:hypothetical protein
MALPPRQREPGLTLGDRLVSAGFGAVVGAVLGGFIALLLTGTSHWVHYGEFEPHFREWIVGMAALAAVAGLLVGPRLGDWLGSAFSGLLKAEAAGMSPWYGSWQLWLVLMAAGIAARAFFFH